MEENMWDTCSIFTDLTLMQKPLLGAFVGAIETFVSFWDMFFVLNWGQDVVN